MSYPATNLQQITPHQLVMSRQPVLNLITRAVIGYDVRYRALGRADNLEESVPELPTKVATSRLTLYGEMNQGLHNFTDGKCAFLDFSEHCLRTRVPRYYNRERIIIQLEDDLNATTEVVALCSEYFRDGYRFSLKNYTGTASQSNLLRFAKCVRVDFSDQTDKTITELANRLCEARSERKNKNKLFIIADNIETKEQYLLAKSLGFDFLQGYVFFKPQDVTIKDVGISDGALFRLYQELCRPEINIDDIHKCFYGDEGLTYKLLTFINSSHFGIAQEIKSIRSALVYMGIIRIRQLLVLLTTSLMATEKPKYLLQFGIIRGRVCQKLAEKVCPKLKEEAFLMGLMSVLPSLLERPMESLLDRLPVCKQISSALLPRCGEDKATDLHIILNTAEYLERGLWHLTSLECKKIRVQYVEAERIYAEAVEWAKEYDGINDINNDPL